MPNIDIKWITDLYHCEACGTSYADGARVSIEGDVLEFLPSAHCYGGTDYSERTIYDAILRHLGHSVTHSGDA
jgi:hypothetical protein